MKANLLASAFVLLLTAAVQLPAQQSGSQSSTNAKPAIQEFPNTDATQQAASPGRTNASLTFTAQDFETTNSPAAQPVSTGDTNAAAIDFQPNSGSNTKRTIAKPQSPRQIAQSSFPSVVLLVMEDANGQPIALGSGFFVRKNVIASNFHVVEGASSGYAKPVGDNTKYDITGIVGVDTEHDLVLLKVTDSQFPVLSLADSRQTAVGDEIFALSNPEGLEGTFSQGIISGIRSVESDTLLQITAPISPGSSGGPVLNSEGKVIGIAAATFKGGQNLNFAIPAHYLAALLAAKGTNVTAFGPDATTKRGKSIFDDLGGQSVEGVSADGLTWEDQVFDVDGNFSFTLHNKLHDSVSKIYCLVIFYDSNDNPLDFAVVNYNGTIPGGLAKRVTGEVDTSVKRLTTSRSADNPYLSAFTPHTKIEFRILDFEIDE